MADRNDNRTDDGLEITYIPPNFKEGSSVFGITVKVSWVIQALPVVALVIIFLATIGASWSFTAKVIVFIVICGPVVMVATAGVNGDSVYGFIRNALRAKKNSRTLLYNPRVKTEIRPLSEDPFSVETLPRERILAFVEKMRQDRQESDDEEMASSKIFFEDDEGIVPKPYEYMTQKERRAAQKEQKTRN